jgi:cytochrome b
MSQTRSIPVWDLPTRLFHWLLLLLMIGAIVSIKIGGNAIEWHGRFGHMIFGLIVFRLVWGVVGGSTARFSHFVRGPSAICAYLRGQWRGIGHNPLGALSVLGLIGVVAFQAITGLFTTDDIAFNGPLAPLVDADMRGQITSWHRLGEWAIYALVGLHVAAVMFYTHVKKDNLVKPMITGRKTGAPADVEGLRPAGWLALVIAVVITGAALWATSGALNPPPPPPPPAAMTPAW